ncbi:MAG TPA: flagellar basal body rod protein FlgC [Candidatus Binatia bacterium]|nr:flagellar basal body rod protein FlgC [Candidatus Binatia bacterium]
MDAFRISASGLAAQRARLDLIAGNLANAESTRGPGGPYRRRVAILTPEQPPFEQLIPGLDSPRGVRVAGVAVLPGVRLVWNPAHPDARADGYLAMPNVNPITEMVDLLQATRAYEANVTALGAAKAMALRALELAR